MNKLEAVEKLYDKTKTKKMLRPIKSHRRAKNGYKHSANLKPWQACMKAARENLGIVGYMLPKKGTAYYDECKRLMRENNS